MKRGHPQRLISFINLASVPSLQHGARNPTLPVASTCHKLSRIERVAEMMSSWGSWTALDHARHACQGPAGFENGAAILILFHQNARRSVCEGLDSRAVCSILTPYSCGTLSRAASPWLFITACATVEHFSQAIERQKRQGNK